MNAIRCSGASPPPLAHLSFAVALKQALVEVTELADGGSVPEVKADNRADPRFHALINALITLSPTAMACQFDTDCEPGSRCVKQRGNLDGYCAGGLYPGNDNDRSPYCDPLDITEFVGDTCSFDIDCGVGARCSKRAGSITGV